MKTDMKILRTSLYTLTALSLFACSGASLKNDREKTSQVKRVALVAIASQQDATSKENILKSLTQSDLPPFADCSNQSLLHAESEIVEKSLQQRLHWTMVPLASTVQNKTYAEISTRIAHSSINAYLPKGKTCYTREGAISYFQWNKMTLSDIRAIKTALKVDAVLVLLVDSMNDGTQVFGVAVGGIKTKVRLQAKLYDGISEEPIFVDTNAQGETIADGTRSILGFADRNELNQKTLLAVESATRVLTERFQKVE